METQMGIFTPLGRNDVPIGHQKAVPDTKNGNLLRSSPKTGRKIVEERSSAFTACQV
jgi:hypothetical protein